MLVAGSFHYAHPSAVEDPLKLHSCSTFAGQKEGRVDRKNVKDDIKLCTTTLCGSRLIGGIT